MELGTTYSVGLGNAVRILDISAVASQLPTLNIGGGFPLAGTVVSISGNYVVVTGTPTGARGPLTGNVTVGWSGGSETKSVTITAVYTGPEVAPTITTIPLTIPLNMGQANKIVDVGDAQPPVSITVASGSLPHGTSIQRPNGTHGYLFGAPTQLGNFTGTLSISYSGVGSPQTKSFSITVTQ
jgi:hypothetical protein